MTSKRPAILMAILLFVLAFYIGRPFVESLADPVTPAIGVGKSAEPLPAVNELSNLQVTRLPDGRFMASVEYAYTGEPKNAMLRLFEVVTYGERSFTEWAIGGQSVRPGRHRFATEVFNPNVYEQFTTHKVLAKLEVLPGPAFKTASVDFRHQWPDPLKVEIEQAMASGKEDAIVDKAVAMIDTNQKEELEKARKLLQKLVELNPKAHPALVELARIAMKTNWSAEGLRDAEGLLAAALQLEPESANAKVLLGYVYTHQGRYKQAEPLFTQAAAANTPNLWLWSNWGELLAMQGRKDAAVQKYMEAVRRPPPGNTYDRARLDAYANLLRLLKPQQRLDQTEALLKQRAQEYPGQECFTVDHATFVAVDRGDAEGAATILRDVPSPYCGDRSKRVVEGGIRYMLWAQAPDAAKPDLLRQARVVLPVSPMLLYWLAAGEKGAAVVRQLVAAGESLMLQDSANLDALSHALRFGDAAAAGRLLRLGANPLAEIGPEKMPAALIPLLNRDVDGVRLLRRSGVDYGKLRFHGVSGVEIARQQGDAQILQLIDAKGGKT